MIYDTPIQIIDNIGAYFSPLNEDSVIIESALLGYKTLDTKSIGSHIPYFLKNSTDYEIGTGTILSDNNRLILRREHILQSSDISNKTINFTKNSNNKFYIFANAHNFQTAFNNTININDDYNAANITATYVVDLTKKHITIALPDAINNQGLTIEIKTGRGNYSCNLILDIEQARVLSQNSYIKLTSDGNKWVELLSIISNNKIAGADPHTSSAQLSSIPTPFRSASLSNATVGMFILDPDVDISGAIQYNNGSDIAGTKVYVNKNNDKILYGANTEAAADIIIPISNISVNTPTVFNNLNKASDFIIKGSGDKNIFFGYEGRLGINIPSGARPQTSLHIINNACQEGIRLENRNQCYPGNLTIYHKPSVLPTNDSVIGTVNLASKNSINNQVNFVQFRGVALNSSSVSTSGELRVAVDKAGNSVEAMKINSDATKIIAQNNSLVISSTGNTLVGNTTILGQLTIQSGISLPSIKWSGTYTSGQLVTVDNNGNLVLTSVANSSIIDLLDGPIVTFTGVCS